MSESSNHPELFSEVQSLLAGQPRHVVLSVLLNSLAWWIIQDSTDTREAETATEAVREHLIRMVRRNWGLKQ